MAGGGLQVVYKGGRDGCRPAEFLGRHIAGDWGEVSPIDAAENALSLARGFRLLSAYRYDPADPQATVWIVTEADRSSTCVLLPSEY